MIVFHDEAVCDTVSKNNDASQINNSESPIHNRGRDLDELEHVDSDDDNNTRVSMTLAKLYVTRKDGLPGRMIAIHMCTPDTPYFSVLRTFHAAMLGIHRSRLRIHVGT